MNSYWLFGRCSSLLEWDEQDFLKTAFRCSTPVSGWREEVASPSRIRRSWAPDPPTPECFSASYRDEEHHAEGGTSPRLPAACTSSANVPTKCSKRETVTIKKLKRWSRRCSLWLISFSGAKKVRKKILFMQDLMLCEVQWCSVCAFYFRTKRWCLQSQSNSLHHESPSVKMQ